jgi:hypothetical protein
VATARASEVEEHEAVENGGITPVQDREEAVRRMRQPISEGHLARKDEGDRPGEQAEGKERAANELEHARDPGQRQERGRVICRREAEQLLRTVLEEDQRGDDRRMLRTRGAQMVWRSSVLMGYFLLITLGGTFKSWRDNRDGLRRPVASYRGRHMQVH